MLASRTLSTALLAIVSLLASAAVAQADTWVDDTSGNNANPCTMALPCQTVQRGVDAAGAGETVRVDGGTYGESVTLGGGKSVIYQEFSPGGSDMGAPVINGGGSAAITVPTGETAATIQGFQLRSTATALTLAGPVTSVTGNAFISTDPNSTGVSVNTAEAGASTIGPSNTFMDFDLDDAERRFGVSVAAGSPTITGNDFSNLSDAIFLGGTGSPTVSVNEITGTHVAGSVGGRAISVTAGTATIVDNQIHTPDPDTFSLGVEVDELGSSTGAALRRNLIFDHGIGVVARDTTLPVTLHSDVIRGNNDGLDAFDAPPFEAGEGDVNATNVTFTANSGDIHLEAVSLTLDSSIVQDTISTLDMATCAITFSRGPTTGSGCSNFQTNADPMFAVDGYHLLAGSPMIDIGNPSSPVAPNDLDVDGDPRAIDENCDGTVRRNIGADEIPTTCAPAVGTQPPAPPPAGTGPTGQRARAIKKCKKKLKGKAKAKKRKKCIKRAKRLPL